MEAPVLRFEDSAKTVGSSDGLPASPPGGFSIVLQHLDGTLPPAVREQSEIVARGLHSLEALDWTFPGGAAAFERQWVAHVEARVAAR